LHRDASATAETREKGEKGRSDGVMNASTVRDRLGRECLPCNFRVAAVTSPRSACGKTCGSRASGSPTLAAVYARSIKLVKLFLPRSKENVMN